MIKYFCDRCEKQMLQVDHMLNILTFHKHEYHLCEDCVKVFKFFMSSVLEFDKPCDTSVSDK